MAKGGKQRNLPPPPAVLQKTVDPAVEEERQRQNREIVMNRMLFGAIVSAMRMYAVGYAVGRHGLKRCACRLED
jgi:hypothetical protein